ncbi:NAD(P)/FAD-dependent oxidoreductase [Clostridium minihomine]|uniref:NAD(P)/FAD-dependent oxidoreductase n=1 Tax=Clostridium minihomine TaxID=2045012 RepID=UPI000C76CA54|nr:aminoacetone oxidase family FAD-binding enzyme [Clostridium minihomine]
MAISQKVDIAIVGGGAAGLMAAGQAAKLLGDKGAVALLEGAPRVGKKLLATGNGRCNLTNLDAQDRWYHGDSALAKAVFSQFSPADVLREFESMGLYCQEEEQGRVYPKNGQASAVLDALRLFFQKYHGQEICDSPVTEVKKQKNGYLLSLAQGQSLWARKLILAQGGKASPQISSDQGVSLARQLGHSETQLFPGLVQVTVPAALVRSLKGVRCPGKVRFLADGHTVKEEEGEIQFTERGLSGVCVFQLSRFASEYASAHTVLGNPCQKAEIAVDLFPELSFPDVCDLIRNLSQLYPELPMRELLFGVLPKRVGQQVMVAALAEKAGDSAKNLTGPLMKTVAKTAKSWIFPVTGTLSWTNAQVTAGGIPVSEVWVPSMESRLSSGMYLAGEQLNVDGDCGGFNLHWAWISGMAAGRSAAMAIKEESHD